MLCNAVGAPLFVAVRARRDARQGGAAASGGVQKQPRLVFAARYVLRRFFCASAASPFEVVTVEGDQIDGCAPRSTRLDAFPREPMRESCVISSVTMLEQRIQQQFFDSADLKYAAAEVLSKPIADGVSALVGCITGGGKVLTCGNGGSAADAQHFAAEFVGRFERERPGLAALALTVDTSILTAVGNDYGYDFVFSKQVAALGSPGDVLIAMSTSGNSANVLAAVEAAHAKDMTVIALTGNTGGRMREQLLETDVHICVPHERTARIQEVHLLVLHCLCDAVDLQLLGDQENT